MALPKTIKAYLSANGRKGGSVSSPAKTAAVRANARKPRPRAKKETKEVSP